jgi:hypothetical protein
MRTLILAAAFACTLLTPAQAQNRAPTSAQLRDFVGQYNLEDGRVLTVSLPGRVLVAQVTGQDAVVLRSAGPAQFVARTGVLRVAFDQHDNGVVTGVTVDTAR